MKYISLFAGIGGFDLALNRLGHECVFANEFDKYAANIYRKHFGIVDMRDLTAIPANEIPYHDLLVGGFPCQAFSVAGKHRGFAETRGTLFFEIARILKDKQPKYFILENVKGLLSHANGDTFKTIVTTLTELGYDLQWQVLNSKDFGVPQNRERVFIIGHIRGESRPKIFPVPGANEKSDGQIVSTAIDANYWKGIDNHGQRTMIVSRVPLKFLNRNQRKIEGDYAYTIDGLNTGGVMLQLAPKEEVTIRRFTPVECERLQGFPDNWTAGISDMQRYKCLGNAVTVNVVEYIASCLE